MMWELEQQLGLLRLYPEKTCGEVAETDSWPSSGKQKGTKLGIGEAGHCVVQNTVVPHLTGTPLSDEIA